MIKKYDGKIKTEKVLSVSLGLVLFLLGMVFSTFLDGFGITSSDNIQETLSGIESPMNFVLLGMILSIFVLGSYLIYIILSKINFQTTKEQDGNV